MMDKEDKKAKSEETIAVTTDLKEETMTEIMIEMITEEDREETITKDSITETYKEEDNKEVTTIEEKEDKKEEKEDKNYQEAKNLHQFTSEICLSILTNKP